MRLLILVLEFFVISAIRSVNKQSIEAWLASSGAVKEEIKKAMKNDQLRESLIDSIKVMSRCDTIKEVFLDITSGEMKIEQIDFKRDICNSLGVALGRCIPEQTWNWMGMKSVLDWVYTAFPESHEGSASILSNLQNIVPCATAIRLFTNVQNATVESLHWSGDFRDTVLTQALKPVVNCVKKSFAYWEVNALVSVLDWAAVNQKGLRKEAESVLQGLKNFNSPVAVQLFLGLVTKKYLAKSDPEGFFRIRALKALAYIFASKCTTENISFDEFMSVLNWGKANPSVEANTVVAQISNHLHYGKYRIEELIEVLDWARTSGAAFNSSLFSAFENIRDCDRCLKLIVATYTKEYALSASWDEVFQNQVLNVVVPQSLVCVQEGGLNINQIILWMNTASVNKGLGDLELASALSLMRKCDQAMNLYLELFQVRSTDMTKEYNYKLPDVSQWKPAVLAEIRDRLLVRLTSCFNADEYSESHRKLAKELLEAARKDRKLPTSE